MISVVFKGLDKSDLAREAATERMTAIAEKFPDLKESQITMTLAMDNSPHHAGPDLFTVKVNVSGGKYGGVRLEKSATNLYAALADVVDHMLEKLNRFGDRSRVKERNDARVNQNRIQELE